MPLAILTRIMILFVVRREYVKFLSRSEKIVNVRVANASYNYKSNVCVPRMDELKPARSTTDDSRSQTTGEISPKQCLTN